MPRRVAALEESAGECPGVTAQGAYRRNLSSALDCDELNRRSGACVDCSPSRDIYACGSRQSPPGDVGTHDSKPAQHRPYANSRTALGKVTWPHRTFPGSPLCMGHIGVAHFLVPIVTLCLGQH